MKQANRPKIEKTYRKILNKYYYLNKIIDVYSITTFNELIQNLINQTLSFNHNQSKNIICLKIECLFSTIQKQQTEITLNLIVKKVMVIFMLMRRLIRQEIINQNIEDLFHKLIDKIMKEDIVRLINPQQKRESSINKIYKYIRDLSSSRDKYDSPLGKTIIEGESDKGAIKEIISQIIEPFCIYMLKILQNKEFYLSVFKPNTFISHSGQLPWKIINYSKMLGQIVYQLYRFSRYFITDLIAICVFMTLLCSKDISIYYDILRECAELKIGSLKKKINQVQNPQDEDNNDKDKVVELKDVCQIKQFVTQIMGIKEKIHYIFGNKYCKEFKSYFSKPNHYSLMDQKDTESFQFILKYHRKMEKFEQRQRSLKKINKTNQVNLFAESIFSQTQPESHSPPKVQMIDIYLGSENDYKLVQTVKTKSRMNSWLSRGQKGKLFPAFQKDQDIISTNGS